jgi:hypothetical protein
MPRMAEIPHHLTLDDYAAVEPFARDVQELQLEGAR